MGVVLLWRVGSCVYLGAVCGWAFSACPVQRDTILRLVCQYESRWVCLCAGNPVHQPLIIEKLNSVATGLILTFIFVFVGVGQKESNASKFSLYEGHCKAHWYIYVKTSNIIRLRISLIG